MKKYFLITSLIILATIFTKLYLGYHWRDSFFARGNNRDVIIPIAENIYLYQDFSISPGDPTIEHEFLYPIIIAGGYMLFGRTWFGITLIQSIMSGLTALFIFLICNKLFQNRFISICAFLLTVFHPYLFINTLSIFDTTLFVFLMTLLILQTYRMNEKPTKFNAIIMGIILALTILTRDSATIFVIPVAMYIIWSLGKKHIIDFLIMLLITVCMLTPWIIRNYLISGKILLSSHGYEVIWQGNNAYSWDYISNDISVDKIPKPEAIKEIHLNSEKRTTETVLAERAVYLSEVKHFVKNNSIEFMRLMLLKFIKFWSWDYNPKPTTTRYLSTGLRSFVYNLYFFPVLLLSLLGIMAAYFIRKKFVIFCFILIGAFTAVHMISVGFTRLRLPLDPILSIFASYGIFFIYCLVKKKSLVLKQ